MIFIDSSYYIARLIEDDKFHKRAIELEPQLNEKRYINSTVLNETLNAFGSNGGEEINDLFIYCWTFHENIIFYCCVVSINLLLHYDPISTCWNVS